MFYAVHMHWNHLKGDEVSPDPWPICRLDLVVQVIQDDIVDVLIPYINATRSIPQTCIPAYQARISVISPILPSRTLTLAIKYCIFHLFSHETKDIIKLWHVCALSATWTLHAESETSVWTWKPPTRLLLTQTEEPWSLSETYQSGK